MIWHATIIRDQEVILNNTTANAHLNKTPFTKRKIESLMIYM